MAWIYFQELVGLASLLTDELERSPIVNPTDMLRASYCRECNQVTLIQPLYGTMCELSEQKCSQKSTSSMVDSRAKTSALQDLERAWQESEVDFFSRSCAWPKKSSPSLYSLKMSQQLELEDSATLSNRWPVPAMIVDGILYPLKKLAHVTKDKDGFSLPTPTAGTYGSNQGGASGRTGKIRYSLEAMSKMRLLPTPLARDARGKMGAQALIKRNSPNLPDAMNGSLNPQFVEEIMGYNIDATALDASATLWFLSRRRQRLKD